MLYSHADRELKKPAVKATDSSELLSVSEFARQKLGFRPDAKQGAVLDSTAARGILLCSRQWGKSTVSAIKAVHRIWTVPESLVVVASRSERQSGEWVRKAAQFVRTLGVQPKGDGMNALSIALPNGSRIVGLPKTEATIRGFSAVSLLLIDEAARVPDDLYKALRPMLAVGGSGDRFSDDRRSGDLCSGDRRSGDLWLMSTPFGKRGFFYEEWAQGLGWERVMATATECARIPPQFLEEERRVHGEASFAQEYLCEFVDNGQSLFSRDLVESVMDEELPPLYPKGKRGSSR